MYVSVWVCIVFIVSLANVHLLCFPCMYAAVRTDLTTGLRDDVAGAVEQFSSGIMQVCCRC